MRLFVSAVFVGLVLPACSLVPAPQYLQRAPGSPATVAEVARTGAASGSRVHSIPLNPAFGGEYDNHFATRAHVVRYDKIRLQTVGPWQHGDGSSAHDTVVVVGKGFHPRVAVDHDNLRILAYVHRDSLERRLARSTTLGLNPGDQRPLSDDVFDFGVTIAGGVHAIEVLEASSEGTRVAYSDGVVAVEGWIGNSDIDVVFEPETFSEPANDHYIVTRAAPLLDRPGGQTLATLPVNLKLRMLSGQSIQGFSAVEYVSASMIVRGVVADDVLERPSGFSYSTACGGGYGMRGHGISADVVWLEYGDMIRLEPFGEPVAMATGLVSLLRLETREDGWTRVSFDSPWTSHEGWVEPEIQARP